MKETKYEVTDKCLDITKIATLIQEIRESRARE